MPDNESGADDFEDMDIDRRLKEAIAALGVKLPEFGFAKPNLGGGTVFILAPRTVYICQSS